MYSYRAIKSELIRGAIVARAAMQCLLHRKKLFLLGTPIHGNLGDHAIAMAARRFLQDHFPGYKIIEVEPRTAEKYRGFLKKYLIRDGLVLNTGGGSFGSLWPQEEGMFRAVLQTFCDNRVIVLPQTIYFSDDEEGRRVLEESRRIYQAHRKLCVVCRERYTYALMKEQFPACETMLTPDMVLYLRPEAPPGPREGVLFCMRKDKETRGNDLGPLEDAVRADGHRIGRTDTVLLKNLYGRRRFRAVRKKIAQFGRARLVVTDRLHGMIFALLAGTPCLVLENKNYKIRGVYEWIRDVEYIKLTDAAHAPETYRALIGLGQGAGFRDMREMYEPLADLIRRSLP